MWHARPPFFSNPDAMVIDDGKLTSKSAALHSGAALNQNHGTFDVGISKETYPFLNMTMDELPQEEMPSEVACRLIEHELGFDGVPALK